MDQERIFLCYRRTRPAWALLLKEKLDGSFGSNAVFMDVHGIAASENFEERLQQEVASCAAMVVVIGPDWLTETDDRTGRPKIQDPLDFVHIEVMTALIRRIGVFPVLIDGAKMPHKDDLPPLIRGLAACQATKLDTDYVEAAADRLVSGIAASFEKARRAASNDMTDDERREILERATTAETALREAKLDLIAERQALESETARARTIEAELERLKPEAERAKQLAIDLKAETRRADNAERRLVRAGAPVREGIVQRLMGATASLRVSKSVIAGLAGAAALAILGFAAPWMSVGGAIDTTFAQLGSLFEDNDNFKDCETCPEMVVIPAGVFTMGSPETEEGRFQDEGPQRRVEVPRFAMSATEVTWDQWDACVLARFCRSGTSDESWGRGKRPVINVSWDDAQAFVVWLNSQEDRSDDPYRLPSEAEWEYAARASSTTRYSFGDEFNKDAANAATGSSSSQRTINVGGFPPNAFGLYDVHGNVSEWTEDCWISNYSSARSDHKPAKTENGSDCLAAAIRGGNWASGPQRVRSAYRQRTSKDGAYVGVGFRVAKIL